MVTDAISDCLFVTEESGVHNLLREGKRAEQIHFVGNVMIDNLFHQLAKLDRDAVQDFPTYEIKMKQNRYSFLTLHRPSNVDDQHTFEGIAEALNQIAAGRAILFPVHPRTKRMIDTFGIRFSENIALLPPLGFREALFLWKDAEVVMTDSGGLQEETTALGVPCVTLRDNTERPITLELGTNILAGTQPADILKAYETAAARGRKKEAPPLWDGKAAERLWEILVTK